MRSGLEIQAALDTFVAKWKNYSGSEKAEAQSFLNELFAAYGTDRYETGALFEDFTASAGFMDLHLPGTLIVEMKAPHITFPWPDPVDESTRAKVASAASALYERRSALCLEHNIGLTKLYNLMDDGGFTDLAALHKTLDVAVAAAYGWPASVAQDGPELVSRLTELNRQITQGEREYSPFA